MKRKVVSTIGCLVLAFNLSACGGTGEVENTVGEKNSQAVEAVDAKEQESAKADKETGATGADSKTEDNQNAVWETRMIADPILPEITTEKYMVTEGVEVILGTSPFNYNIEDIKTALNENEFLKEYYNLALERGESFSGETYEQGDFFSATVREEVCGDKKNGYQSSYDYYTDFTFSLLHSTSRFTNPSSIYVKFYEIEDMPDVQEKVYSVLEDALGQELAEYLVYAKQEETETSTSYNLERTFESEGTTYGAKRKVEQDRDGEWTIQFDLYVENASFEKGFEYCDGGYQPLIENAKYNVSAITNGGISDFDIRNFKYYAPEYMNIYTGGNYSRTVLSLGSYAERRDDDGGRSYDMSVSTEQGYYDISSILCPEFDVDYTIYEEGDGSISYIDIWCTGTGLYHKLLDRTDETAYYKQVTDILKAQVATVVPTVDLSDITYENLVANNYEMRKETTVEVLGVICECEIVISLNNNEWDVNIDYVKQ